MAEAARVYQHPSNVVCTKMRQLDKGALVGFVDLEIPAWNLALSDCRWFRKDGREWIGLPSSRFQKSDGATVYKDLVAFTDKDTAARFEQAALAAIHAYRPGDHSREGRPRRE